MHILQPPEEIREAAARAGVGLAAILMPRGYAEIAARATSGYDEWVGLQGSSFRPRDDAQRLGDVVKFHWIERDYTFVVA